MGRRKCWVACIFMILALVNLDSFVFAAGDDEYSRETLRGLPAELRILVEWLKPEIEQEGLTTSQLETDVELKLRLAGIKVVSENESYTIPGSPFVYVHVNILKSKQLPVYAFNAKVEFLQDVSLVRDPKIRACATTWSVYMTVLSPKLAEVRAVVKDLMDEFINAYLSVNPK